MNLSFREAKTTQAAAQLLKLRGAPMSYMKLVKLLYLVDRQALLRWGRPVTGDKYVSMDKGPVLSRTLNLIIEEPAPGDDTIWAQHISQPQDFEIKLKEETGADELSPAEIQLINETFAEFGKKPRWELVDFVHDFPEWQDPHGSALPIEYRDILQAGGKSEAEIAAVLSELDGVAMADALMPAR